MVPFSIVIICRNEAAAIGQTLQSLKGLTDDIVVYDNGSTDDTMAVARQFGAHVQSGPWEGFGKTKNRANAFAKYDWILSLDADEAADETLRQSMRHFNPANEKIVYEIRFLNFLGKKPIRYGEWGRDRHIRLFNRNWVRWNNEPVHETLLIPSDVRKEKLSGAVLHLTMKDMREYAAKVVQYAMLSADKYARQGKRSSWFRIRLSPAFNFLNYYLLKGGFLDGYEGYVCAKMTAHYTFLKYARLRELNKIDSTGTNEDTATATTQRQSTG